MFYDRDAGQPIATGHQQYPCSASGTRIRQPQLVRLDTDPIQVRPVHVVGVNGFRRLFVVLGRAAYGTVLQQKIRVVFRGAFGRKERDHKYFGNRDATAGDEFCVHNWSACSQSATRQFYRGASRTDDIDDRQLLVCPAESKNRRSQLCHRRCGRHTLQVYLLGQSVSKRKTKRESTRRRVAIQAMVRFHVGFNTARCIVAHQVRLVISIGLQLQMPL